MANLPNGRYLISTEAGYKGTVSRHRVEDLSLNPKRILLLPPNSQPEPWEVRREGDQRYTLLVRGAPVFSRDGHLYASLLDERPHHWNIKPQPQHGEGVYTIESEDEPVGWVIPDPEDPETQVATRPLIQTMSLPPQFPGNQLFRIRPIGDY